MSITASGGSAQTSLHGILLVDLVRIALVNDQESVVVTVIVQRK